MKFNKTQLSIFSFLFIFASVSFAQEVNIRPLKYDALPQEAKSYISEYFSDAKIVSVTEKEQEYYKVVLNIDDVKKVSRVMNSEERGHVKVNFYETDTTLKANRKTKARGDREGFGLNSNKIVDARNNVVLLFDINGQPREVISRAESKDIIS